MKEGLTQKDASSYIHGRGAQINTGNRFIKTTTSKEYVESIDDWTESDISTSYIETEAKSIMNKVDSPDLEMEYSMNPYAGCEHGCIYCFARNAREYWGYSAGLDFESKILVKKNAPQLLRKFLMNPSWECQPIMMSGNTDCYQPAEKKFKLTKQLLETCLEFNQPVSLITKNSGMLRDKEIIKRLAEKKLISIIVSITTLNESLRRVMEPRTTTAQQRLRLIKELSMEGVPMGVILGPMIPGLNDHEMHNIMKAASEHGATFCAYTMVRLNGSVKLMFHDWLYKNFPGSADKVWHLVEQGHDGKVNDTRFGTRIHGDGKIADILAQQFRQFKKLYGMEGERWELDTTIFRRPGEQGKLF
ncbi:MAG: PA0069 family radical SAM protein [Ferruginibacter sp.]